MSARPSAWRISRLRGPSGAFLTSKPWKYDETEQRWKLVDNGEIDAFRDLLVQTMQAHGYSGTIITPIGEVVVEPTKKGAK